MGDCQNIGVGREGYIACVVLDERRWKIALFTETCSASGFEDVNGTEVDFSSCSLTKCLELGNFVTFRMYFG